jgi:monovalent cation/hydrogen antiporter
MHCHLDDAPIEIAITLLTPFAAYLLAETLDVSGVLAVMATGLYLSRQSSRFFSSNTRLQANAVWYVLVFLLNGLVFLLFGLQLRSILEALASRAPLTLLFDALDLDVDGGDSGSAFLWDYGAGDDLPCGGQCHG